MAKSLKEAAKCCTYHLLSKEKCNFSQEEIIGDETVLKSKIFEEVTSNAISKHKVENSTAFISLCTNSRPYNTSPKWKGYNFKNIDKIVFSNGFLASELFWNDFILLTYNAPASGSKIEKYLRSKADINENPEGLLNFAEEEGFEGTKRTLTDKELNDLYSLKMYENTVEFFKKNKYKYIFADILDTHRSFTPILSALKYLKLLNIIEDYDIPRREIYKDEDLKYEFKSLWGYPTLQPKYIKEMKEKLERLRKGRNEEYFED